MKNDKGDNSFQKYALWVTLSILSILLPIASGCFMAYEFFKNPNIRIKQDSFASEGGVVLNAPLIISIIVFVVFLILSFALRVFFSKHRTEAMKEYEYDEFGRSKKKSFEKLSRKEREKIDLQRTADMERILSKATLKKIIKKGSENPNKDLESLVGMYGIKKRVKEMVARMEFENLDKKEKKTQSESTLTARHMVFFGSAGTGKTTVARIITGFLYQYGYIKENKCVEIDGNFLKCGSDSSVKTDLVINASYGGVLFIDEAYSIMYGYGGDEAIATLIKRMEDNRGEFILILAGYRNEISKLLAYNEGFKSRIKEYFDFPDYTDNELSDIFGAMANDKGYVVSLGANDNFLIRVNKERKLKGFGNARTVRNILDESIDLHATNFINGALKENDKYCLCACDVSVNPVITI